MFIAISPNNRVIQNRAPIHTAPPWKVSNAYQMLQTLRVSGIRLEADYFTTYRCNQDDFNRLFTLSAEQRGMETDRMQSPLRSISTLSP
jgi:hypothetical protein